MENALLAARLLLAGVLGLAGATKLADRQRTRLALVDFGISRIVAGPISASLVAAELAIAAMLLWAPGAWLSALASGLLLLSFAATIGWNLAHGRRPACRCFGQLHSAQVSWATALRDLLLAAIAGLVVSVGPQHSYLDLYAWIGGLDTGWFVGVLAAAGVVGLLLRVVWLLSRRGAGQETLPSDASSQRERANVTQGRELPVGSIAPAFEAADLAGHRLSLEDLLSSGKPVLLAFLDPQCGPCLALLPELALWEREQADTTLVVLSRGEAGLTSDRIASHGFDRILLIGEEVAELFGATGSPSAMVVSRDRRVVSSLARGLDGMRALIGPHETQLLVTSDGAALPADARPRVDPAVHATELDEDLVVYDPRNGCGHVLNVTGAQIWQLLDGERTVDEITQTLAEEYNLAESQAAEDVRNLVSELHKARVIVI